MSAEIGYAKINLALHVRGREPDGYHRIETLFAFAEDGDHLSLQQGAGLEVTGPFAAALGSGDNLVLRAADSFGRLLGQTVELGFKLDKRLPIAAGIGGGSADAAAALRLLCAHYGIFPEDARVQTIAAELGADVPACLWARTIRGDGRGDRLTAAEGAPRAMPLLLVNPLRPLVTGSVFDRWDGIDRGPLPEGSALQIAMAGRNDLETPAIEILPVIGALLEKLSAQPGTRLSRMSGSGATCYALFDRDESRDAAAFALAAAHPDWWFLKTRLR